MGADMSEQQENSVQNSDGLADAWAAVALITLAVTAAVFWLAGQ
jgi:hypothetical protein